ncbi:type IV secretory system conjugative DNA transfer family protein, partial [Tahibacter soli]
SKMVGQKTVLTSSQSFKTSKVMFWNDFWRIEAHNLQHVGVPLITPDEVMRVPVHGKEQRQIIFLQGQHPVFALKIPFHVVDAWAAAAVRAPVSVQLDQPPMPPSETAAPSPRSEGMAAAASSAATIGPVGQGGKIPLATKQGSAYIKGGNKRKGQGMAKTYEFIDKVEESAERMHDGMVDAAREAKKYEQKARALESKLATLSPQDPSRGNLIKHLDLVRFLARTAHQDMAVGRQILDADNQVLAFYKEEV